MAAALGAVNCVVNREGTLRGENTDGAGFLASLARGAGLRSRREALPGHRGRRGGPGGGAGAGRRRLRRSVGGQPDSGAGGEVAALAGPVGRVGEVGDEADVARGGPGRQRHPGRHGGVGSAGRGVAGPARRCSIAGQVVADLVYAPRPTPWLAAAARPVRPTVDGLGMLVHQAAAQLELWTGLPAPVDRMWAAASGE